MMLGKFDLPSNLVELEQLDRQIVDFEQSDAYAMIRKAIRDAGEARFRSLAAAPVSADGLGHHNRELAVCSVLMDLSVDPCFGARESIRREMRKILGK